MSGELRRAALTRVSGMRSARAADVLTRAILEVEERAESGWESSDGTVRGVDVRVLVDGYALGLLSAHPSVSDAVIEAITSVAPSVEDASVVDLTFAWALRERSGVEWYRDSPVERADPRSSEDVKRALAAFLFASGDPIAAQAVEAGELELDGEKCTVLGVDADTVEPALSALLGPRVRVRRGPA